MTVDDIFSVDAFVSLPRVEELALSPDGRRLVTTVAEPDPDGTRYRRALWESDPTGDTSPRRLTRSAEGESTPVFLPGGDLLFVSSRPRPEGKSASDEPTGSLWVLPASGEARCVAAPPGGVTKVAVAADSGAIVVASRLHPASTDWDGDAERATARKDAGVTAQLHTSFPMRYWDRWLGPRRAALFAADDTGGEWATSALDPSGRYELAEFDVTPDGTRVVSTRWADTPDPRDRVRELVVLERKDEATAEPRTLAAAARVSFESPACSPDGTRVVCVRRTPGAPDEPGDVTLAFVPIDGSAPPTDALPGFGLWPTDPVWTPDGRAVCFTADDGGHCLPYRLDVETGEVRRLAAEGAYSSLVVAPDATTAYAVRSSVHAAPHVVALDLAATDQQPRRVPSHGDGVEGPGHLERVTATAADGAEVPGWLVLPPAGDGPAPLAVFVHGGPLSSWNSWSWRWCPQVLAARGWAVLLPDPALSTGYGREWVRRGWGRWGAEPYTDVLALVDAVGARDDIDERRTCALGGSFGGYMVNWIAGHTDRFDAIVTHASLWNLEAFHGTTDMGPWWENEFGDRYTAPERYRAWSPHRFVDRISTPMLVIHGEKDFRVPVSEGLSLWTDLRRHGVDASYLHFPDENHWVLTPQHAKIWYQTVIAFIEHHVLGAPWEPPDLLS